MSQPRIIVPGATHFVTRRTIRRHHLFAPDPRVRQLFLYALAVAADRYDILVHLAVLMSTHEHLTLTDVLGRLPEFLAFFHRIVALSTKVLRKWEGPVWDHEKPSIVELLTPQAVGIRCTSRWGRRDRRHVDLRAWRTRSSGRSGLRRGARAGSRRTRSRRGAGSRAPR